ELSKPAPAGPAAGAKGVRKNLQPTRCKGGRIHVNDLAISIQGLSKSYALTSARPRATTMGEALAGIFRRPLGGGKAETFWALRDLSVDVHRGEVVGV